MIAETPEIDIIGRVNVAECGISAFGLKVNVDPEDFLEEEAKETGSVGEVGYA